MKPFVELGRPEDLAISISRRYVQAKHREGAYNNTSLQYRFYRAFSSLSISFSYHPGYVPVRYIF